MVANVYTYEQSMVTSLYGVASLSTMRTCSRQTAAGSGLLAMWTVHGNQNLALLPVTPVHRRLYGMILGH